MGGQINQRFRCLEKGLGQLTKVSENEEGLGWIWEKWNSQEWKRRTGLHHNKQKQQRLHIESEDGTVRAQMSSSLFSLSLTKKYLHGFYLGIPP